MRRQPSVTLFICHKREQNVSLCAYMDYQFDALTVTFHFQDLSNYQNDKMINKSLALLNKYYSSKTKLFKMSVQAMVSSQIILVLSWGQ